MKKLMLYSTWVPRPIFVIRQIYGWLMGEASWFGSPELKRFRGKEKERAKTVGWDGWDIVLPG